MTCFVVSDTLMHRCIRAICETDPRFSDENGARCPTELGRKLFALNVEAVRQRYRETEASHDSYVYSRSAAANVSTVALLKALTCLIYQCAEGDVVQHPMFAALERVAGELAIKIVRRLPEWDRTPNV